MLVMTENLALIIIGILTIVLLVGTGIWYPLWSYRRKKILDKYPFESIYEWRTLPEFPQPNDISSGMFQVKYKGDDFQFRRSSDRTPEISIGESYLQIEFRVKINDYIDRLDVRFNDSNDASLPEISDIIDVDELQNTVENLITLHQKTTKGMIGDYDKPKHVMKTKAIDYVLKIKAGESFLGHISFRFWMNNANPSPIILPCKVK